MPILSGSSAMPAPSDRRETSRRITLNGATRRAHSPQTQMPEVLQKRCVLLSGGASESEDFAKDSAYSQTSASALGFDRDFRRTRVRDGFGGLRCDALLRAGIGWADERTTGETIAITHRAGGERRRAISP